MITNNSLKLIEILETYRNKAKFYSKIRIAIKHPEEYSRRQSSLKDSPKLQYYAIDFSRYEQFKNPDNKLDYEKYEILMDYFEFFILKQVHHAVKEGKAKCTIKIAYRVEISPDIKPEHTGKNEKISEISKFGDVLYSFEFSYGKSKVKKLKLPAFHGILLFNKLHLFPNQKFEYVERAKVVSDNNTNKKSIKQRDVIDFFDLQRFNKVSARIYHSLKGEVKDMKLFKLVEQNHMEYEEIKTKPSWQFR